MSADAKPTLPMQIHWHGSDVEFAPADEGRLLLSVQCGKAETNRGTTAETFVGKFKSDLLPRIRRWCEQNRDKIAACYFVPFGFEQFTIFAVAHSTRYDFSLSDKIADFEMDLFEADWSVEVRQIPSGSPAVLDSFFNLAESIQVYGHGQ